MLTTTTKPTQYSTQILLDAAAMRTYQAAGYVRLARAVLLQAIKEAAGDLSAVPYEQRKTAQAEAREWLESWTCYELCEWLGIDHEKILAWLDSGARDSRPKRKNRWTKANDKKPIETGVNDGNN